MTIRLQYFSTLRDLRGPSQVEIPAGARVSDLLTLLYSQVPKMAGWDRHLLVAAGTEYVTRDSLLAEDQIISLMPPVQGG